MNTVAGSVLIWNGSAPPFSAEDNEGMRNGLFTFSASRIFRGAVFFYKQRRSKGQSAAINQEKQHYRERIRRDYKKMEAWIGVEPIFAILQTAA